MDGVDFAMLVTLWASLFELGPNMTGKPEDFNLDVLALKPSGLCNVRVITGNID